MAERSSSKERQRAEKDLPSDTASAPGSRHAGHDSPASSRRSRGTPKSGLPRRSARPLYAKHFTLYVAFASTKKQGLRLRFGVRAGASTARNRAKRQAREAFRFFSHKLPDGIDIMIAARNRITALTRREIRDQLAELFDRACALSAAQSDSAATKQ